jgi:hypothetical protein
MIKRVINKETINIDLKMLLKDFREKQWNNHRKSRF